MSQSVSPMLNHVAIYVQNLEKSINFYCEAFGLSLKTRWEKATIEVDGTQNTLPQAGVHLVDQAGHRIELWQAEESLEDGAPAALNHFAFTTTDVEAQVEKAVAAGAKVDIPFARVSATGLTAEVAFVTGPDGERIELLRYSGS